MKRKVIISREKQYPRGGGYRFGWYWLYTITRHNSSVRHDANGAIIPESVGASSSSTLDQARDIAKHWANGGEVILAWK